MNAGEIIVQACDTNSSRAAFVSGRNLITYSQLRTRIDTLCGGLARARITTGDTIAFAGVPSLDALALLIAATCEGINFATLDVSETRDTVHARLAASGATVLIVDSAVAVLAYAQDHPPLPLLLNTLTRTCPPQVTMPDGIRTLRLNRTLNGVRLPRFLTGPTLTDQPRHGLPVAPANRVQCASWVGIPTSGTTNNPRIVYHTPETLAGIMKTQTALLQLSPGDRVAASQIFMMLPVLASGATFHHLPANPARAARTITRTNPRIVYAPVWALSALLAELDAGTQPLAGTITMTGSAPVPIALLARARALGADEAHGVYACTEATPIAHVEHDELASAISPVPGAHLWGHLAPEVNARMVDGRLQVSGPNVAHGYSPVEPFSDGGWADTGDIVLLDDQRVWGLGRAKRMLLRFGHNIYPELLETALAQNLDAELEAVRLISSGNDPMRGDEVTLLVEPKAHASTDRLLRLLARELAHAGESIPDHVVITTLARSRNGKPLPQPSEVQHHVCASHGLPPCFHSYTGGSFG